MKRWTVPIIILIALWSASCALAEGANITILTNESTDAAKGRVGWEVDESWELGFVGAYYLNEPDSPWSAGLYAKLSVNPEGEVALTDWLPGLGDLLGLPETVPASTYLLAEGQVTPIGDGGIDFIASVGPGVSIGFITIELLYSIIEGGDSSSPLATSGTTLWMGLGPIRF